MWADLGRFAPDPTPGSHQHRGKRQGLIRLSEYMIGGIQSLVGVPQSLTEESQTISDMEWPGVLRGTTINDWIVFDVSLRL